MKKIGTKLITLAMSAAMALTLAPSAALTSLAKEEREDRGERDIPGAVMELSIPVYGFYNPNSGEHMFTVDMDETDFLREVGWTDEGVKWYAPTVGDPVYRLYNPNAPLGDHYYSVNPAEVESLVSAGWKNEDVALIAEFNLKKKSTKDMSDTEICVLAENLEKWANGE